jgi:flavin reductase (DIM6/NTAB) family NADH-FMN oxidoreductase RutF
MFYRPGPDPHGLPHNPFKAIVAPRPIGWIGTIDADGRRNLAPYSFFNAVADTPPLVMYASNGRKTGTSEGKDTVRAIAETGEFTVNIVSYALRDAMNVSSGPWPAGEDEFAKANLTASPSETIAAPRVAEAPASLECRLWRMLELPGKENIMVIGEVVGVHIDDAMIVAASST